MLSAFSSGAIILKHVAENDDDNLTTNSFFTDDQPWPAFLDCIFASEFLCNLDDKPCTPHFDNSVVNLTKLRQ